MEVSGISPVQKIKKEKGDSSEKNAKNRPSISTRSSRNLTITTPESHANTQPHRSTENSSKKRAGRSIVLVKFEESTSDANSPRKLADDCTSEQGRINEEKNGDCEGPKENGEADARVLDCREPQKLDRTEESEDSCGTEVQSRKNFQIADDTMPSATEQTFSASVTQTVTRFPSEINHNINVATNSAGADNVQYPGHELSRSAQSPRQNQFRYLGVQVEAAASGEGLADGAFDDNNGEPVKGTSIADISAANSDNPVPHNHESYGVNESQANTIAHQSYNPEEKMKDEHTEGVNTMNKVIETLAESSKTSAPKPEQVIDSLKEADWRNRMELTHILESGRAELVSGDAGVVCMAPACLRCGQGDHSNHKSHADSVMEADTSRTTTQQIILTVDEAQVVNQADPVQSTMEAGDADGEDPKLFFVLDSEVSGKGYQTSRTDVFDHSTSLNLVAGGDAGLGPVVQLRIDNPRASGESAAEVAHLNQRVKSDPEESSDKDNGEKAEPSFEVTPALVPIKAIPALNAPQTKVAAVDNVNVVPYIPPDTTLLYQPEDGVMKSKPVPKPTRGRHSRRSVGYTPRMRLSNPVVNHPELRALQESRRQNPRYCQHYALTDPFVVPAQYGNMTPIPGCEYGNIHPEAEGEMIGYPPDLGNLSNISPRPPSNSWYCGDEYFKIPQQWYAASRRGRSSGRAGRPRGRRGAGGVRQYLQHRLLWARYTGRSQEALDRVLTIINSKCSAKGDAAKETAAKPWNAAEVMDEMEEDEYQEERLDDSEPPYVEPEDPFVYNTQSYPSNGNNLSGSNSNVSMLSQNGIGSNAVVDGNGYIVYLNADDTANYADSTFPFVPQESQISGNRGNSSTSATVTGKAPYCNNDIMKERVGLQPTKEMCSAVETTCLYPDKLVIDGVPIETVAADMGETTQAVTTTTAPQEGCTPTDSCVYSEDNGKRIGVHKRLTPRKLETPVSPVKGQRARKRQGQTGGGQQKKKVRRSLIFSSPIKQEETLTATENIANALTNTCETKNTTKDDNFNSTPTSLPSISSLLQSATNTGISINIHVTNDVNGERSARASSEDVVAERVRNSLEHIPNENSVRGDMGNRPTEASTQVHYPLPRYTVEWNGRDYQGNGWTDRPHQCQLQHMPYGMVNTGSNFRYPYRDPNSSLGYYAKEHHFHPLSSSNLDHYYTTEYPKDWSCAYNSYPPEHYLASYEPTHTTVTATHPSTQMIPNWSRNMEMYVDPYQETLPSRASQGAIPYSYYHRTAPFQPDASYPDEGYLRPRSNYGGFVGNSTLAGKYPKQKLVPGPGYIRHQDVRQDPSYRMYKPWLPASNIAEQQVTENDMHVLNSQANEPPALEHQADGHRPNIPDPGHIVPERELTQIQTEHTNL